MKHAHRIFNRLPYVAQLKDAGFNEKQSQALLSVIEQQQLTKNDMNQLEAKLDKFQLEVKYEFQDIRRDIKELRAELSNDIKELRTESSNDIKELRAELSNDIKELRTESSNDIKELRTELSNDIKELRTELKNENAHLATDLLVKLGTLMALFFTLFSGVLGLFIKMILK